MLKYYDMIIALNTTNVTTPHYAWVKFANPITQLTFDLTVFLSYTGTFISAFTVLCCGYTETTTCKAFFWNLFAALLQALTFIFIVGWIWSISWGMTFVTLSGKSKSSLTMLTLVLPSLFCNTSHQEGRGWWLPPPVNLIVTSPDTSNWYHSIGVSSFHIHTKISTKIPSMTSQWCHNHSRA